MSKSESDPLLIKLDRRKPTKPLLVYSGHVMSHIARQAAVSPDEKLLAAVGQDKRIRVWDVRTGAMLHNSPVADASLDLRKVSLAIRCEQEAPISSGTGVVRIHINNTTLCF
eukprot:CAMPEP_0202102578 /NCGR_PEP_ID=MMETSP0965-20130614/4394_1 /ASSEMBLY_ACC=CAM_ASM_000507 /TAXON_ID=4773 /ORGANISM="Schizochytrium aggregatum, Strain ATCC28209" /LENGTH=111 /DNA_ID=CAMNT_0048671349 /DNA_START=20 /DNA_END=355 /DNA_ORIENTATION=-